MSKRETWNSRLGFIMAAVGSAIGLGNIWRFPYIAYENGGGAFLIPYIFAMLTAGIPFMILEFGLGHRFRGGAPKIFASISSKWEWLGWWQVLLAFAISCYYVVVIGWSISYIGLAVTQGWGQAPGDFFFKDFLQLSGSPLELGSIRLPIFAATALAWGVAWFAVFTGIRGGIERANKIFMPILFILVFVLIGRIIFMPGAINGVEWLYRPNFSALLDYRVWADAYGQIFYSLSLGFSIMLAYSSYLPKKSDINNNAFMTVFINCGFSMVSGVMIFGVLGYMAAQQGVGIDKVVSSGVGLAFVTIPTAVNLMPMPALFGTLFFAALGVAGVSSLISLTEGVTAGVVDKFGTSRKVASTVICVAGCAISAIFTTNGGLLVLDIVDHFINNFGILTCGLIEIVFISWFCNLDVLHKHVNSVSDFTIGGIWKVCLRFITPFMLGFMSISNLIGDISANYGGYSTKALVIFGWMIILCTAAAALVVPFRQSGRVYATVNDELNRRS